MKKYILIFMLFLLIIPTQAFGAELILKNQDGKVILDKSRSVNNNEYILNNAEAEEYTVLSTPEETLFTEYSYSQGFFDNPFVDYTTSFNTAAFDKVIDNNLSTYSTFTSRRDIYFDEEIYVSAYYLRAQFIEVTFYYQGESVYKSGNIRASSGTYQLLPKKLKIDRIGFYTSSPNFNTLYEFDIFAERFIDYSSVSNLKVTKNNDTQATITFDNPKTRFFLYNDIILDNKVIISKTKDTNHVLANLEIEKEYTLTVRSYYTDGKYVDASMTFRINDTTPPDKVKNLVAEQQGNEVKLTYDLPTDDDFSHVKIYRNGILIADNHKESTFLDTKVKLNTQYTYRIISVDQNNNLSEHADVTIFVVSNEVNNLKAKADFDEIELTWENPLRSDFEKVVIYRKKNNEGFSLLALFSFLTNDNNDNYEPLFETNGTQFKDLTVKPDTTYNYRINTLINGNESDGVFIDVKTPKTYVKGIDVEENRNDDDPDEIYSYTITWEKPTTGKIKVLVGGKQYKIVNASDKKIVIPAKDMKFTLLGDPDVTLIPLDENGNEIGVPTKPGTGNGGGIIGDIIGGGLERSDLTPGNLLLIGVSLLGLVGAFVLLGLAFKVVPKLIGSINTAFRGKEFKEGR